MMSAQQSKILCKLLRSISPGQAGPLHFMSDRPSASFVKFGLLFACSICEVSFPGYAAAGDSLNFSRAILQLPSPDKAHLIYNAVAAANKGTDLLYVDVPDALLLRGASGKSGSIALLKYHRNIDVFWALDSKSFVLNDWSKSSFCDAYLYKFDSLKKRISLRQSLLASDIPVEERALIANRDHSYVFVDKWDRPDEIAVKASGHYFFENETVSYTLHYLWDMKSNKWKLLKKESSENLERDVPNLANFGA